MPTQTCLPDTVQNEAARAVTPRERRRLSVVNKRRRLWIAEDPSRETLVAAIAERAGKNRFMRSMAESVEKWGSLLPNQESAVRRNLDDEPAKAARRDERRARDADSAFVGEVGARQEFTLTVEGVFTSVSDLGTLHSHVMRDGDGNVVTYRGSMLGMPFEKANGGFTVPFETGSRIVLRATVKGHDEYDGTKRTVLQRPTVVDAPPPRVSEVPFERHAQQTDDRVRFPTWGWQHKAGLHVRRKDGRIVPWTQSREDDVLLLPTAVVERAQGVEHPIDPGLEGILDGLVLD